MGETCQLVAGSCITGATLGLFRYVTYITSLWDSNILRFWSFKNPKISIFIVYKKRVVISEGECSSQLDTSFDSTRKNNSIRKHILYLKMCFLVELFFLVNFYMKRPLVYYANQIQIYVNRKTMTVGLLKHAIFSNHSFQY